MNTALILSGGVGLRLGSDIPKQYLPVDGKMIITHCLRVFGEHPQIDAIRIVAHKQWHQDIRAEMPETVIEKFVGFSTPGTNRQRSIFHGLKDMMQDAEKADIVIVHDAVRPFVSASLLSACIEACKEHEGVIPVLPVKDTVYWEEDDESISLLDRERVYAGQAPEAFQLEKYYEANEMLLPDLIDSINGSTEPAIMAGMDITRVSGDERNFKITTQADLERCKHFLSY